MVKCFHGISVKFFMAEAKKCSTSPFLILLNTPYKSILPKHHQRHSLKDEILKELSILELERDIKILYAVESGSRAWGFASADSDWDVRFIYVHRLNWYLQIDDRRDTIDRITPDKIDLGGWDLRKALVLFRKSNPPFLEWLYSPLVYADKFSVAINLRKLVSTHFSPKSCIHHYLNMAT